MNEMTHRENPNLPAPDTVVVDNPLAEHMGHAAHPGYEKLIRGGRDLSINQAAKIGMEIGESMEAARRDHLAQTAGSEALANTVATHDVTTVLELPVHGYPEARRGFFEQNVGMLQNTVTSVFDTIRGKGGFPQPQAKDTHKGFFSTEEITLYDPLSKTINQVSQTLIYEGAEARLVKQSVTELKPVEGTETEGSRIKRTRAEGRLLVEGRTVEIGEEGEVKEYKNEGGWTGDRNPEDIIKWSQRLANSFPLKDPSLVQKNISDDGDRISLEPKEVLIDKGAKDIPDFRYGLRAYYREPVVTKDLKRLLAAERERFEVLKNPAA